MHEGSDHESSEQPPSARVEVRNDCDMYVLSGVPDTVLIDLGLVIGGKLDPSIIGFENRHRESLQTGQELRPGGAFACQLMRRKDRDELWVELRNGRGYEPMRKQLQVAV